LLGKEVEKGEVPKELGAAPSYNPRHRSSSGSGRKPQRRPSHSSQDRRRK
jgi:hypothetical protein